MLTLLCEESCTLDILDDASYDRFICLLGI